MKKLIVPTNYTPADLLQFTKDNVAQLEERGKKFFTWLAHQHADDPENFCACPGCVARFVASDWIASILKPAADAGELASPFPAAVQGCVDMISALQKQGAPIDVAAAEALNGYLRGNAVKRAVDSGYTSQEAMAELQKALGMEDVDLEVHVVGMPDGSHPVLNEMPPLKRNAPAAPSPHDEKLKGILASMENLNRKY
jgi:hypothetical protein